MVTKKSEPGLHDSSPNLPSPSPMGMTSKESGRKERLQSAKHKKKEIEPEMIRNAKFNRT
jgi:hypothetical protein